MRLIVLDTESTTRAGQICQLACLTVDGDSISGKNLFFAVDSMSESAQRVHGLSVADLDALSGGQRFADRAKDIADDIARADLLVGHNISADIHALRTEFDRLQLKWPDTPTLCTMNRFTPILKLKRPRGPASPKPPKLPELCDYYSVSPDTVAARCREWFGSSAAPHDARFDAAATYLCLQAAITKGDIAL